MDIYTQLVERIIRAQEDIIGPIALEQAQKVAGITSREGHILVEGNKRDILDKLVSRYKNLFGLASVEVCRKAVKDIIGSLPTEEIPPLLIVGGKL